MNKRIDKTVWKIIGFVLCCIAFATTAYAIPTSYGEAKHKTPKWQELGKYDGTVERDEYGVFWSTDGGITWGREELYVGQAVQFRADVHKENVGTHYADLAKIWVDWGQDGKFDETNNIDDSVLFGLKTLETPNGTNRKPTNPNFSFFSEAFKLDETHVGDLWLRARVTCSASLVSSHDLGDYLYGDIAAYNKLMHAVGTLHQGEGEVWKLTVNAVPEPSTMLLFGTGIAGLAAVGRKRKK